MNNTNSNTHLTFETEFNQGKKSERAWAKVRELSDEVCKKYELSIIEDPDCTRGASHFEWEMQQLNLSWKARLKYAIDQVVKVSENFEDFLQKCADFGILVEYNPNRKIDLKFMLAEQKRNNPNAKFTRARTLGWFYETPQIKNRIINFKKNMAIKAPKKEIIETTSDKFMDAPALTAWADRENMKEVSKAVNEVAKKEKEYEQLQMKAQMLFGKRMSLKSSLEILDQQIHDFTYQLGLVETYVKYKPFHDKEKTLKGRKKKKYQEEFYYELDEYSKAVKNLRALYPDGNVPSPELYKKTLEERKSTRRKERVEFNMTNSEIDKLTDDMVTIEKYLSNERQRAEREERRRKNGELE